jgi:hypothetical protein
MPLETSKADEFRKEAEELRIAARGTRHKITRETLLKLAKEYERMAEHPITNQPKKLPRSYSS